MSKQLERELAERIGNASREPLVKDLMQLLDLRLERYKDTLISTNSDLIRGRAGECRDLLKDLMRQSIDTSPST